ncbi:GNAT family N-acetyltransferase [Bacillus infantis]|uniref:GNAT family N-acetyltransferase n=1 Tax=Bacillus infantis TaxID=324767 RepID=UPI00209E6931|nr:GNAT family N-acetyltransferase [Bacillus infantis]MCP1159175.1 GNAT family N-acetyltransferase [Bacillus infantis]
MDIRKAELKDIRKIMEIVKKTVEIMKQENNDQWTDEYPAETDFLNDIKNGTMFTAVMDGEPAGAITCDQVQAEQYSQVSWQKEAGECYVFHRLVVDPEIRGAGIASRLISFAEQHAVQRNVPYMRTDTYSLNKKAQKLFEKNGYKKAGQIYMDREHPFFCYDKLL